jgi:hypothetical protein
MGVMRAFFWAAQCFELVMSPKVGDLIYLLPIWVQFATFSLLALYYAQVLQGRKDSLTY